MSAEGAAFDRLLAALAESEVAFVLVGGLALGSWGVVRATKDVDVVVDPARDNLERLAEVAARLESHVQREDMLVSSELGILGLLLEPGRVLIETSIGALDVLRDLDGVPSYAELADRAVDVDLLGTKVRVCSLDDLCAMKRAAGRTRDLADLEDLDALED